MKYKFTILEILSQRVVGTIKQMYEKHQEMLNKCQPVLWKIKNDFILLFKSDNKLLLLA